MKNGKLAMVTLMFMAAGACQSGMEPEPTGAIATVPVLLAYRDSRCRTDAAGIKRLEDAAALADWWRPLATGEYPAKPLPQSLGAIDFDTTAVFVVSMGPQSTAGYDIELHDHQASVQRGSLTIPAFWREPAPESMVPQVTTNPCVVITVPASRYETVTVRNQKGSSLLQVRF